ncbi:MAG: HDOD domain-containing protein [Dehalococcoidia bacterium]
MPHESAPTVRELAQRVAELRPIGAVAARTLQLTEGDQFSAHELARVIASDQVLTTKLLRLANSAYYGFPRRISTVRDAVVLLGFREVRATTIASSVIDAMNETTVLNRRDFWFFSVATGMLAEVLARADHINQGEAFTAGVVHQIGRLALDQHEPELLRAIVRLATHQHISIHEAESAVLGYTDADLGAVLAEMWNFPPPLIEAVRLHHRSLADVPDPRSLAAQVIRAREFARSYGMSNGIESTEREDPPDDWLAPAISGALASSGGAEGIFERVSVFLEHALPA